MEEHPRSIMKPFKYYINTLKLKRKAAIYRRQFDSKENQAIRNLHREKNAELLKSFQKQPNNYSFSPNYISFNHTNTTKLYQEHTYNSKQTKDNPIHQPILALLNYNLLQEAASEKLKFQFLEHIKSIELLFGETNDHKALIYPFRDNKYKLQPGWTSAICQGLAASAFIRAYQLTDDKVYLKTAKSCLTYVLDPNNQLLIKGPSTGWWAEEYPSEPPSYVLNGFIFFIIALLEYEATSSEALQGYTLLESLIQNIHLFQYKDLLLYDLLHRPFANVLYQNIHSQQMLHLRKITGFQGFLKLDPKHYG